MIELTKQDWIDLKKSAEANLKQHYIASLQYTDLLSMAITKIKEIEDKEVSETEKELKELENADTTGSVAA